MPSESKPSGFCPHCDYPINPGICPECGNQVDNPLAADARKRRLQFILRSTRLLGGIGAVFAILVLVAYVAYWHLPIKYLKALEAVRDPIGHWAAQAQANRLAAERTFIGKRFSEIETERDRVFWHEWADCYQDFFGDQHLCFSPNGNYAFLNLAGGPSMQVGTATAVGRYEIHLQPTWHSEFESSPGPTLLYRVKWGNRQWLLEAGDFPQLRQIIDNGGLFPAIGYHSKLDPMLNLEGDPDLPPAFRPMFPPLLTGRITRVGERPAGSRTVYIEGAGYSFWTQEFDVNLGSSEGVDFQAKVVPWFPSLGDSMQISSIGEHSCSIHFNSRTGIESLPSAPAIGSSILIRIAKPSSRPFIQP